MVSSSLIPKPRRGENCGLGMKHRLTTNHMTSGWNCTVKREREREREREGKIVLPLTDRLHTEQVEAKQRDFTQAGPLTSSPQSLHRLAKPTSE